MRSTIHAVDEQPLATFEFRIDDALVGGNYANMANVWHTQHEFTIDFGVMEQATVEGTDGQVHLTVPVRTTTRVRLPISLVFPLARALSDNITQFESVTGMKVPTGTDVEIPPDFRPEGAPDE